MKKEIRAILKNRAVAIAKEPEQKKATSAIIEVIVFTLASETYGIESVFVREICHLRDITTLPGVPDYVFGIINVRGQILPVIDLKKFFNLPGKGLGEMNKVIILSNDQMEFGILADAVVETQTLALEDIFASPTTVIGIGEKYLKGVTKEYIVVLDAESILNDEKIIFNDEVI
jgi:purine-binding chemotaxis protein CheW